ncbi:hypothetical protein EZV62_027539 [Acer yangbiense]|uniref:Uncharacterized protein n=1 Tax=Acer yangbiense TaxID=1000413 RepID=A0A5C7GUM6_9ROSI|nr:hypothetical protein EZV62_027539 [Acer yangbiense]
MVGGGSCEPPLCFGDGKRLMRALSLFRCCKVSHAPPHLLDIAFSSNGCVSNGGGCGGKQWVLREIGIAPAQLNPNAWRIVIGMFALWRSMKFSAPKFTKIGHCYIIYSNKSRGDGWWALACYYKQEGEPLITGLPSSNKEWKKLGLSQKATGGKIYSSMVICKVFTWCSISQVIGSLLHMEKKYEDKRERYKKLKGKKDEVDDKLRVALATIESQKVAMGEMSASYRKAKSKYREKHAKLCDYRGWSQEKIFDRAVKEIKEMLLQSYPSFNFFAFDAELKKAIETWEKEADEPVEDISGNFKEVSLSDDEPMAVSSDDERFGEKGRDEASCMYFVKRCAIRGMCFDYVFDLFLLGPLMLSYEPSVKSGELNLQGIYTGSGSEGIEGRPSNEDVEGEGYVDDLEADPYGSNL